MSRCWYVLAERCECSRRCLFIAVPSGKDIDSTPAVLRAVLAGGGLSVLPDCLVAEHITSGRLSLALSEWRLPSGGIYAVFPSSRFRPPKVTTFADMLTLAAKNAAKLP